MGNKDSRQLKYCGEWRKGKHFDEKQRLLFESGSEDKGKVEMAVDLFKREFRLHLKYCHTQWYSKDIDPSGRIDIHRSKIKASGHLAILPDRPSTKRYRRTSGAENAPCIAIECTLTEFDITMFRPSWINVMNKKKQVKFSVLTEEDVARILSGLLGMSVGSNTIPELSDTVISYLPHTFWVSCGRIHHSVAHDIFTFPVELRKGSKMSRLNSANAATILPIPASAEALVAYINEGSLAADNHTSIPLRCTDPRKGFALRVITH
uniref:Uncharacterized protein n=1 Tax=Lotharella globosa TaxID=91324 RepID=A0A6U3DPR0_9EUKA|mmetsp:Transcript_4966/g.9469  ORF Transcript_4966/g.9469 Transcript_4966/m.9469 type:complete len:264 (+) Transcript_4966:166-957(+)|eukprot:CAMPEP_0167785656 /NCGR_PEP_ID=MMETSP0111_2-20121227/8348_1 /TAXON_ID=91324 /ORGANISM="Lotharella globosa, Strain CCCM811" /LENGTH=263 /DNA_ID=CAMNT_0007676931 /DNA_START=151 /DNA_END=942 /DNA_ORIENTATION=-